MSGDICPECQELTHLLPHNDDVSGHRGRMSSEMNRIPFRSGARPKTSDAGPHSQTSDQSPPELWGRLVAEAIKLQYVVEGNSAVSPISSRASNHYWPNSREYRFRQKLVAHFLLSRTH